jgi:hypothetical protein
VKTAIALILAVAAAGALWFGVLSHRTPTGQPPMAAMDLAQLRADFNRAADRPRLILLLSPT